MTTQRPNPTTIQDLRDMGLTVNDPSSINDFLRCNRYYFHRHEEGLTPINRGDSFKLDFGIALHLALAEWFRAGRTQEAEITAKNLFLSSFTGKEEQPRMTKRGLSNPIYTCQFGLSLLTYYFQTYAADMRTPTEVELPLMEEIAPQRFLVGVVDLILSDRGGLIVSDHKSTSSPERFNLNPNLQFMTYSYLVSKFGGLPPSMVTGEADFLIISKSKDPSELLTRVPFSYSDHQMLQWERSVVDILDNITQRRLTGQWPHLGDCKKWFKDCPYMSLCTATTKQTVVQLKQTAYKVEWWNPLAVGE